MGTCCGSHPPGGEAGAGHRLPAVAGHAWRVLGPAGPPGGRPWMRWRATTTGSGSGRSTSPAEFWASLWDYFDVLGERGDGPVLAGGPMPDADWFPGATLNYARNALRTALHRPGPDRGDRPRRGGPEPTLTYAELPPRWPGSRAGLAALGVTTGDRVAALPAQHPRRRWSRLLATASLGAIWSSCSPDFGAAQRDRPLRADRRRRCCSPSTATATAARSSTGGASVEADRRRACRGLAAVVMVDGPERRGHRRPSPAWPTAALATSCRVARREAPLSSTDVPFGHPLWVLYSSGTTGLPKADRARPRRDRARAPQGAVPAPGPRRRATCSSGTPPPAG